MTERDKVYHVFVNHEIIKTKIIEWYKKRELVPDTTLVICNKRVETIEEQDRQRTIILNYHNGLTNHRGAIETLTQLKRKYYWIDMLGTIKGIIAECSTCNMSKYERHPAIVPQQITETPKDHLEEVQADIWYWEGTRVLTIVDIATRFLFTKCIRRKTGQIIREGILEFCATVGIPKKLIMDPGAEFENRAVKGLLEELRISSHITTPGHPRSHGVIERLHSTLGEHMRLLEKGKGITGSEAVIRATIAYNESVHSATGKTPMELMRAWRRVVRDMPIEIDMEKVRDRVKENKIKRIEHINERKKYRKPGELKVGMRVYIKNLVRRNKNDALYNGPYLIKELLNRHRVILRKETWGQGKEIIRHIDEVRVRHKKSD
ncbi:hypothetical protein AAG570_006980 [Ranatra chinensis]|uniref:RNA-directed DNA polymerase n=1 Tax=Ranatra chinensis TaxID=642074 RepID=A0ABD0ZGT5_9HEMI